METPPRSNDVYKVTPIPASLPPVEGRDDIGCDERREPVVTGDDVVISREPAEGRNDIARDIEQERAQSYSSRKDAKERKDMA